MGATSSRAVASSKGPGSASGSRNAASGSRNAASGSRNAGSKGATPAKAASSRVVTPPVPTPSKPVGPASSASKPVPVPPAHGGSSKPVQHLPPNVIANRCSDMPPPGKPRAPLPPTFSGVGMYNPFSPQLDDVRAANLPLGQWPVYLPASANQFPAVSCPPREV
jgi:hypothetical protein